VRPPGHRPGNSLGGGFERRRSRSEFRENIYGLSENEVLAILLVVFLVLAFGFFGDSEDEKEEEAGSAEFSDRLHGVNTPYQPRGISA
jgi:hypothetical protein